MQPGRPVAGYPLVRLLGEGPFGASWLATDARAAPLVLKLLKPSFLARPAGQTATLRLAAATEVHARIRHPGVGQVFGVIQDPSVGAYGVALACVEGASLDDVALPPGALTGHDPRALISLIGWFEQVGQTVDWLHQQGVIHGNLKPTNVRLVQTQTGLAPRVLDAVWSSIGLAAPAPGQPTYLAPEQLRGIAPTDSADQYALARMLAAQLERAGDPTQVPGTLTRVLGRALQEMPVQRFPSLSEFIGALGEARARVEQGFGPSLPPPVSGSMSGAFPLGPALLRGGGGGGAMLGAAMPGDAFAEEAATVRQAVDAPAEALAPVITEVVDAPPDVDLARAARALVPAARPMHLETREPTGDLVPVPPEPRLRRRAIEVPDPDAGLPALALVPAGRMEPRGSVAGLPDPALMGRSAPVAEPRPDRRLVIYGLTLMVTAGGVLFAASHWIAPPPAAHHDRGSGASAREGEGDPTAPQPTTLRLDSGRRSPPTPARASPVALAPVSVEVGGTAERPRAPTAERDPVDRAVGNLAGALPAGDGCDDADLEGCVARGEAAVGGGDVARGRALLERACELGRGEACARAADLFAGAPGPKEQTKAVRLFERACKLMDARACHEAALRVRAGRGTPENLEKADVLERKACSLGRREACPRDILDPDAPRAVTSTSS
jgi:hypothetical protein